MKKYSLKRFGMTFLALFLLFSANSFPVYGAAVPDLSKEGSVTVAMEDPKTGEAVPGGSITLFQVGSLKEDNGNYSFVLTKDFKGSKESLETPGPELAARLAAYAGKHDAGKTTLVVGSDGKAEFTGLKPGLYLFVQEQEAEGYYPVSPFLVSIPLLQDGKYTYEIDAVPKMELLDKKPGTPGSDDPSALDHPLGKAPRTGDGSRPVLFITLLALGAFGLAGTLTAMERRKYAGKN